MLHLILKVRETVLGGESISREDAMVLIEVSPIEIPYLAAAANEVRIRFVGGRVESCALSNIKSGNCSEDCKFCAQSGHYRTDSPVYPQISADEIVAQAKAAEAMGATEFCLVSSGWARRMKRILRRFSRRCGGFPLKLKFLLIARSGF